MADDAAYVLSTPGVGARVYLKGDCEYELTDSREDAEGFYTSKAAKHQVRRLEGSHLEDLPWTIETPINERGIPSRR